MKAGRTSRVPVQRGRLAAVREAVSAMLWPVPTLIIAVVVAAGILLPQLDAAVDRGMPRGLRDLLFGGGSSEARQLLSAIATGLIATVALVFSLTVVVFQLASSQYSPRMLRVFPRDGLIRATLGVLVGSFVYAITVLRTVQANAVPRISITVGFVLTVAGAVLLVVFLGHVVTELRVETMLRRVHSEQERVQQQVLHGAEAEVEAREDEDSGASASAHGAEITVTAAHSGFITAVDEADLLETADDHGVSIRLRRQVGEAVTAGTPLASYRSIGPGRDSGDDPNEGAGDEADDDPDDDADGDRHEGVTAGIRRAVVIGFERTGAQDLGYGIQQLVDVYVRALSPAINDPTTAVTSLGHLGSLLAGLAGSPLHPRRLRDGDGRVRVVVAVPSFAALLEQALGPVRTYGSKDPRVVMRALEVLRDIGWVAPRGQRRDAVVAQIGMVCRAADEALSLEPDRRRVRAAAERACAACDGRWD